MPYNISRHLREAAKLHPQKPAVILSNGKRISFEQLNAECDRFATAFSKRGIRAGMRVAIFVRSGFSFVPTIFACFRIGAIPVFIDPGMKLKHFLSCIQEVAPSAVVGIPFALLLCRFFRSTFSSVKVRVSVPRVIPGKVPQTNFEPVPTHRHDTAAILFTSGSTGIPKGVVYTHGAFDSQRQLLKETYSIALDEIDLVVFPLFALFSAAWGITAVIPKMNPAKPAKTSGKHLAELIRRFKITHTSGSPAIWQNLTHFCEEHRMPLPGLRRILIAGAQVPERLVRSLSALGCSIHTPYGATEALPLTTVSHSELFQCYDQTRSGAGTCVGKPIAGVDIAIIPFNDDRIDSWDDRLRCPPFIKGEITVRARWVTESYFARDEATRLSKISSPQGTWHRMGDVGYFDDKGRLWFCGRKDHRIIAENAIHFPDPIEAIIDGTPSMTRSALVGVGPRGKQKPILVIEGKRPPKAAIAKLWEKIRSDPNTQPVQGVLFKRRFPVDVRHNIKIDRLKLGRWAEEVLT